MIDTIADPLLVLDAGLCVQAASRSYLQFFKVDREDTIGKHLWEIGKGQWNIADLKALLIKVVPNSAAVVDYRVEQEFPGIGRKVMLLTARTLVHPDGALNSLLLTIVDVTERSAREAVNDIQRGEAVHRLRNLLALVTAVAQRTETQGRTAQEYKTDFLERCSSLVEAEELAFGGNRTLGLGALVERVLRPYASSTGVVIEGKIEVTLSAGAVMALAMILHELATNAAKYGALARPGGVVQVGWRVEADGKAVRIEWIERGGPPVAPPKAPGYGMKMVQQAASYALGGKAEQEFRPDEVRIRIAVPLGPNVVLGGG